jgi:hypothetical protein
MTQMVWEGPQMNEPQMAADDVDDAGRPPMDADDADGGGKAADGQSAMDVRLITKADAGGPYVH